LIDHVRRDRPDLLLADRGVGEARLPEIGAMLRIQQIVLEDGQQEIQEWIHAPSSSSTRRASSHRDSRTDHGHPLEASARSSVARAARAA
jgi:hypothetical protein